MTNIENNSGQTSGSLGWLFICFQMFGFVSCKFYTVQSHADNYVLKQKQKNMHQFLLSIDLQSKKEEIIFKNEFSMAFHSFYDEIASLWLA